MTNRSNLFGDSGFLLLVALIGVLACGPKAQAGQVEQDPGRCVRGCDSDRNMCKITCMASGLSECEPRCDQNFNSCMAACPN